MTTADDVAHDQDRQVGRAVVGAVVEQLLPAGGADARDLEVAVEQPALAAAGAAHGEAAPEGGPELAVGRRRRRGGAGRSCRAPRPVLVGRDGAGGGVVPSIGDLAAAGRARRVPDHVGARAAPIGKGGGLAAPCRAGRITGASDRAPSATELGAAPPLEVHRGRQGAGRPRETLDEDDHYADGGPDRRPGRPAPPSRRTRRRPAAATTAPAAAPDAAAAPTPAPPAPRRGPRPGRMAARWDGPDGRTHGWADGRPMDAMGPDGRRAQHGAARRSRPTTRTATASSPATRSRPARPRASPRRTRTATAASRPTSSWPCRRSSGARPRPARLQAMIERLDDNGDGLLQATEIEERTPRLRRSSTGSTPTATAASRRRSSTRPARWAARWRPA